MRDPGSFKTPVILLVHLSLLCVFGTGASAGEGRGLDLTRSTVVSVRAERPPNSSYNILQGKITQTFNYRADEECMLGLNSTRRLRKAPSLLELISKQPQNHTHQNSILEEGDYVARDVPLPSSPRTRGTVRSIEPPPSHQPSKARMAPVSHDAKSKAAC